MSKITYLHYIIEIDYINSKKAWVTIVMRRSNYSFTSKCVSVWFGSVKNKARKVAHKMIKEIENGYNH